MVLTPAEFHQLPLVDKLTYLYVAFDRCFVEHKPPFIEMRRRKLARKTRAA